MAFFCFIVIVAAGAGVHGCGEEEVGGIGDVEIGACDLNSVFF